MDNLLVTLTPAPTAEPLVSPASPTPEQAVGVRSSLGPQYKDQFGLHMGTKGVWLSDFYRGLLRFRRSTGTTDYAEALQTCARWKEGGVDALPRPRTLRHTLEDLEAAVDQEFSDGRISAGTKRLYLDRLRFFRRWHVAVHGREVVLHRIDTALIRSYIRWRESTPVTRNGRQQGEGHLPTKRTVVHDLDTLRALFRRALKLGWMDKEPTQGIPRDRKAYRPRVRALDASQVRSFLDEVKRMVAEDPRTTASGIRLLPSFCEVTFVCGLRREETRMLTRDDIDLRREVVMVRSKTLALTVVLPMDREGYRLVRDALDRGIRCQRGNGGVKSVHETGAGNRSWRRNIRPSPFALKLRGAVIPVVG